MFFSLPTCKFKNKVLDGPLYCKIITKRGDLKMKELYNKASLHVETLYQT